jgi:hypothetical protein
MQFQVSILHRLMARGAFSCSYRPIIAGAGCVFFGLQYILRCDVACCAFGWDLAGFEHCSLQTSRGELLQERDHSLEGLMLARRLGVTWGCGVVASHILRMQRAPGYWPPKRGYCSPKLGLVPPKLGYCSPKLGLGAPKLGYCSPKLGYWSPKIGYWPPKLG